MKPGFGNIQSTFGSSRSSSWTPQYLVVEDAAPTHVVITFPSTKTVSASDFTIAGFTVNSGSWTGSVYTLVLNTSVIYGDVLNVVYKGKSYTVTNNVESIYSDSISCVVENAAPTHVVVTYSHVVSLIDKSLSQVTDHSVSSISLDGTGKILTIVLSTPVIYFDELTLAISIGDTINLLAVTNNVLDDGLTVAAYDRTVPANVVQAAGVESIYWDIMKGSALRGAEESSGTTVAYGVYEITATQTSHFFTGCAVGNIFPAASAIALDANNKVKRVTGNHLTQPIANAAHRPTNGIFPGLVTGTATDGSFMLTPPFTFNQPCFVYIVLKQIVWSATKNCIFDGIGTASGLLYMTGTTPELKAHASIDSGANANLPVGQFGIVRALFNGANGLFQIDNTTVITGDFGARNMSGFTLGKLGSAWQASQIEFKGAILRHSADGADYQTSLYNVLNRKYTIHPPVSRNIAGITRYGSNPIIPHNTAAWNSYGQDTVYPKLECKIGTTYYALSQVDANNGTTWNDFALYTSIDLINWTAYGVVFSNRVGEWDDHYMQHPTVIKIGSTFYLYYASTNAANKAQIGLATSTDFINWTRYGNSPIYTTVSGAQTPSVIKIGSTYYMYYWNCQTGANTKIEYATSSDGINWTYGGITFGKTTVGEADYRDASTLLIDPWVIKNRQGYYEMVYTAVTVPNDALDQVLCYATSWDGITWFKHGIILEKAGAGWESGYLGDPVLLELSDGTANLYYCGTKGHPGDSYDGGLATLSALV